MPSSFCPVYHTYNLQMSNGKEEGYIMRGLLARLIRQKRKEKEIVYKESHAHFYEGRIDESGSIE